MTAKQKWDLGGYEQLASRITGQLEMNGSNITRERYKQTLGMLCYKVSALPGSGIVLFESRLR